MGSETNPVEVLSAESHRLGAFVHFWRQRIEVEKTYLDNLSGLQIPDPPGNGQLQELAHKTHELLMDEIEERRRGFEKLQVAYKALTNEFWTEEGPSYFERWGRTMEMSLRRIDSLAAEVATAESLAERLSVEAREENSPARKEGHLRSNVLSRLLKARSEQPDDTSSFLGADSAYRQKVQKLNDEKYTIQNEIVPQTTRYAEHDRKCIVALRHVVSAFSAVQSDLAQVLNVTSSQLCTVSSSVDASVESASFAQRLDEGFPSLIQPYRYTNYEISSSLRPTTVIFGCPLPDELDGASIGQRAVSKAFEMILRSAAERHSDSLYRAICDAHEQQGDDIKLSALQLESIWDSSQRDGGPGAVDYLAKAPSSSLLVYFLTRLPTPLLPLHDSEIKKLAKLSMYSLEMGHDTGAVRILAKACTRMGTARRCNVARLFLTLQHYEHNLGHSMVYHPEGVQIVTRSPDFLPESHLVYHFVKVMKEDRLVTSKIPETSLILPEGFIEELKHAGLLK